MQRGVGGGDHRGVLSSKVLPGGTRAKALSFGSNSFVGTVTRAKSGEITVMWGVSGPCADLHGLHRAYDEARAAAGVRRRIPAVVTPAYDELGLVRFLLPDSPTGDMQRFAEDLLGPVLDYDRRRSGGSLMRTIEAFLRHDCRHREAAAELAVHAKTLSYRLQRIHELSGLDLGRHDDRIRADIALRINQIRGQR